MTPFFLRQFLSFLTIEKRFSEHTIIAYRKDIEQFIEFSGIQNKNNLVEIDYQMIRAWLVQMVDLGNSSRTISRKLSSLRTFFNWLQKEAIITSNPVSKIKSPKTSKRLPVYVREKDLDVDGLEVLFNESFEGVRNKLIIEILYQTGIRLSELINLKTNNVGSVSIKVLGKRNKERIIPISIVLKKLIDKYLNLVIELGLNSDYLFVLKNGKKLYPKLVYRIINFYLGNVTDLDKRSPHVLRHTFATHMLNNGAGLETLKDLLGHASLSATQVYTHNSFTELTNIYSQTHPRGFKKK